MKIRKAVDKLTVADLVAFPIWEFAIDEEGVEGQDETWVRPVKRKHVPSEAYSQLVAADFRTAKGEQLQGFMMVTTAGNIKVRPGGVVGRGIYLVLPDMSEERARKDGLHWVMRFREDLLKRLRSSEEEVFPISYTLRVLIRGENALRSGD